MGAKELHCACLSCSGLYRWCSMMHTDASVVAPLNYVRLVWAVTIGVVVFGDWPGPAEWIGGTLIVGSGLYVLYTAARAPR